MAQRSKLNDRKFSSTKKTQVVLQTAKLPPQNIEAEQSLLGALLIDKDAIVNVAEVLTQGDFYRSEQHGLIYNSILILFEKREPVDVVTVTEVLRQNGDLDKVGGVAYLAELVNQVPTAAHIMSYARIIKEHSTRRRLISDATKFVEEAYDEGIAITDVIEECEQSIFAISQQNVKRDFIQLKDAIALSFDRLDELQKSSGKLRGVPTGFRDLDRKLAGFQDSNLIILAARPGLGKTSYALNISQYVAVTAGLPVGFFSLEMSQEELVDRLLVTQADIDAWKLKTGNLTDGDFAKLSDAMGQLAEAPMFIDDTPGASLAEIRTKARRLQAEHGLRLIVVDYLQLIRGSGRFNDNRVQEVSEISQGLKNLARELKVPVLALSQLSRQVEQRGTRKPQLADLRESGCLAGDTLLMRADTGELVAIKDLVGQINIPIFSLNSSLKLEKKLISKVFSSGFKKLFEIKTRSGRLIKASANHPFLTKSDWQRVDKLKVGDKLGVPDLKELSPDWDEITSIVPLNVEEVFDATVPETHNFIANDFIVHNSIEQDADVVMFLYKEDPEAFEQVKLDIQKHRNGPTGEIDLIFKGDRVKFYGMEKARIKTQTTKEEKESATPL